MHGLLLNQHMSMIQLAVLQAVFNGCFHVALHVDVKLHLQIQNVVDHFLHIPPNLNSLGITHPLTSQLFMLL